MVTALALHPTDRRRLMDGAPHAAAHEVVLRPLSGVGPRGLIVGASEQSFIEAVLNDLKRPDWQAALAARQGVRRGADGVLELHQPIHRRHYLALFEAHCRMPGSPRLDPRKIDGMGLVLRRERGPAAPAHARLRLPTRGGSTLADATDDGDGGWDGWMNDGPVRRGWLGVASENLDPNPAALNRARPASASQLIAGMVAERAGGARRLVEQVMPLFAAPPEVCEALGRTVLYGLVPVSSPEQTDAPPPAPDYAALPEAEQMRQHLSSYLKARAGQPLPHAGELLDPAWRPLQNPPAGVDPDGRLNLLAVFLQQVLVELGALDPGSATGAALLKVLGEISLPTAKDAHGRVTAATTAAAFVQAAAPILVSGQPNTGGAHMPLEWPRVGADLGGRLTAAALACLGERFAQTAPKTPKFSGDSRRYAVRGFLRVRQDPACPPKLVWSDYSESFRIVPWWDSDGPAARISLPAISKLKSLKPNVSFELPPELANLLAGDPSKLKDGQGSTGGVDIFWLCSFSLPAISICAYIVLSIFLGLFNIVFFWMAWIKICIPIPRPK